MAFPTEDPEQKDDEIRMNRVARKNTCTKIGDDISVHACPDIKNAAKIHILPFGDSIEGVTGNLV